MNQTLTNQRWKMVSVNEVLHSFLNDERKKCLNSLGSFAENNIQLIDNPDFTNEAENYKRAMMLSFRLPILLNIPSSTIWYKVSSLNKSHSEKLIVINDVGWRSANDKNELLNVAQREKESFKSSPSECGIPILWGHTKNGPFTIIEGNHRFVALASSKMQFNIKCYIGLSPDLCCPWHLPDCSG